MKKLLFVFFSFFFFSSFSYGLDDHQIYVAKQIVKHSKKQPKNYQTLLITIALIESSLGKNLIGDVQKGKSILDASLGVFQIRIKTARWLINYFPQLQQYKHYSDWAIANKLINDLEFQVKLATVYIDYITTKYGIKGLWRYNGSKKYQDKVYRYLPLSKKIIRRLRNVSD